MEEGWTQREKWTQNHIEVYDHAWQRFLNIHISFFIADFISFGENERSAKVFYASEQPHTGEFLNPTMFEMVADVKKNEK